MTVLGAKALAAYGEPVSFSGIGLDLRGELFLPVGEGPFPAVVALHGCSGLYGRDGTLSPRHADWAVRLQSAGFIVLFVDSFGSRGAASQCHTKGRVARAWKERVDDALAAMIFLRARRDVKADAISLVGWSNGATTVLYVLRKTAAGKQQARFASAVAFYPGCRVPSQRGNWHTSTPLLILIGAADDWTPAAPCQRLAAAADKAGEPVTYQAYPGAYHDFDHPQLKLRVHHGLAYSGDGSGTAHTGTDPAARADAIARVPAFLAR
jgi:dienelactone hydrolase